MNSKKEACKTKVHASFCMQKYIRELAGTSFLYRYTEKSRMKNGENRERIFIK